MQMINIDKMVQRHEERMR
jgi:hypothetical protein